DTDPATPRLSPLAGRWSAGGQFGLDGAGRERRSSELEAGEGGAGSRRNGARKVERGGRSSPASRDPRPGVASQVERGVGHTRGSEHRGRAPARPDRKSVV